MLSPRARYCIVRARVATQTRTTKKRRVVGVPPYMISDLRYDWSNGRGLVRSGLVRYQSGKRCRPPPGTNRRLVFFFFFQGCVVPVLLGGDGGGACLLVTLAFWRLVAFSFMRARVGERVCLRLLVARKGARRLHNGAEL